MTQKMALGNKKSKTNYSVSDIIFYIFVYGILKAPRSLIRKIDFLLKLHTDVYTELNSF